MTKYSVPHIPPNCDKGNGPKEMKSGVWEEGIAGAGKQERGRNWVIKVGLLSNWCGEGHRLPVRGVDHR